MILLRVRYLLPHTVWDTCLRWACLFPPSLPSPFQHSKLPSLTDLIFLFTLFMGVTTGGQSCSWLIIFLWGLLAASLMVGQINTVCVENLHRDRLRDRQTEKQEDRQTHMYHQSVIVKKPVSTDLCNVAVVTWLGEHYRGMKRWNEKATSESSKPCVYQINPLTFSFPPSGTPWHVTGRPANVKGDRFLDRKSNGGQWHHRKSWESQTEKIQLVYLHGTWLLKTHILHVSYHPDLALWW